LSTKLQHDLHEPVQIDIYPRYYTSVSLDNGIMLQASVSFRANRTNKSSAQNEETSSSVQLQMKERQQYG
jgi:hypothetical protein